MLIDTDPYVSRGERVHVTERQDPVIYPTDHGTFLNREQIAFYDHHGFLFIPQFFSEQETRQLLAEQQRLWETSQSLDDPKIIREPGDETIRSIFAVHDHDPFFAELAHDPRLEAMARHILGSDTYIHQSRINFKAGFSGKDFYWHSDFETWHVEDGMPRMRALSMSIALTENYAFNGPVMVMPGSHRYFVSCVGQTPKNHYQTSLRQQRYGIPDHESLRWLAEQGKGIEMPTGPQGSLLLFDCNIMHGSNSNISPYPRSNIFLVFNSVHNRLAAPFGGTEPRPPYIATR